MKKEKSRFFGEVKLAEGESASWVQVLKTGTYRWYSDPLHITSEVLNKLKANFDSRVKKVDLAVDYFHYSDKEAAGWIKAVEVRDGGSTLFLNVEWTERAREKINAKEIKYMSIDFDLNYIPNDSSIEYGPALNGAAVTNRPFIKGMSPLFSDQLSSALDEIDISKEKRDAIRRILDDKPLKGKKIMELTDLKKECAVLSEEGKAELRNIIGPAPGVVKMAEENTALKKEAAEKDAKIVELSEKVKGHDAAVAKIKKESEFATLMSEGKAVEAQRESFLAGDMTTFLSLAVPVNLGEKGKSNASPAGGKDYAPKTQAEAQDRIIALAETKRMADPKLTMDAAQAAVLADPANKDIVALYEKGV